MVRVAMVVGFFAYGVSLVFFVIGLRHLGTARTTAYFSVAPLYRYDFSASHGRTNHVPLLVLGVFVAIGVWLHVTEHHEHEHTYEVVEHTTDKRALSTNFYHVQVPAGSSFGIGHPWALMVPVFQDLSRVYMSWCRRRWTFAQIISFCILYYFYVIIPTWIWDLAGTYSSSRSQRKAPLRGCGFGAP
ncbi:MAG: hypothetical protein HYX63_12300 [Gammaproteobacteria bacterium]|nr:hypothetical protein [Gammaproteobacteria bacterium]